jgi:hypothetical protein
VPKCRWASTSRQGGWRYGRSLHLYLGTAASKTSSSEPSSLLRPPVGAAARSRRPGKLIVEQSFSRRLGLRPRFIRRLIRLHVQSTKSVFEAILLYSTPLRIDQVRSSVFFFECKRLASLHVLAPRLLHSSNSCLITSTKIAISLIGALWIQKLIHFN